MVSKAGKIPTKQPDIVLKRIDLKHSTLNILFDSISNEMMFFQTLFESIDRQHKKGKEKKKEKKINKMTSRAMI